MNEDLRLLALEIAQICERYAERFPKGEVGAKDLRQTAGKLKRSYAQTRPQQKLQLLENIADGSRQISDFVEELGFSRREVESMLRELVDEGFVLERTGPTPSERGGRRPQWFELTKSAELKLGGFLQ